MLIILIVITVGVVGTTLLILPIENSSTGFYGSVREIELYTDLYTLETNTYYLVNFDNIDVTTLSVEHSGQEVSWVEMKKRLIDESVYQEVKNLTQFNPKLSLEDEIDFETLEGTYYIKDLSLLNNTKFVNTQLSKLFGFTVESFIDKYSINPQITGTYQVTQFQHEPGEFIRLENHGNIRVTEYKEFEDPKIYDGFEKTFDVHEDKKIFKIYLEFHSESNFIFEDVSLMTSDGVVATKNYKNYRDYSDYSKPIYEVFAENHRWTVGNILIEPGSEREGFIILYADESVDLENYDRFYVVFEQVSTFNNPVYVPLYKEQKAN
jgi:hypothetical protein